MVNPQIQSLFYPVYFFALHKGNALYCKESPVIFFPALSHTFVEIDHEIISMTFLLPSAWLIQEWLLSVTSTG